MDNILSTSTDEEETGYFEYISNRYGRFIKTLMRQWLWIVACCLGVLILAIAFSLYVTKILPRSYTAVALVASSQTSSSANFDSGISSASETQLATVTGSLFYDRAMRLKSLVSQIQNGAIAVQVLQELGPTLKDKDGIPFTASDLQEMVTGELIPQTDTIQIAATYSDPIIATEIANAWGKAYVQQVNEIYSSSGTNIKATEAEVGQARSAYHDAETALEDFIKKDRTTEYQRRITEITKIVTLLGTTRSNVGESQVQDHINQLADAWKNSHRIELFIDDATSMRAAVKNGGEPAAISNALALTMLKTQIYSAYEGSPNLQVQNLPEALGSNISKIDAAGMVADLDALISTLETWHTDLDSLIGTLSSESQNEEYLMNFSISTTPIETKILENEQDIRDLAALVASQTSTLTELTQARDLAWKSYSALATRATEISVNAQNTQVVFASSASGASPNPGLSPRTLVLLAAVGLLLGIISAFAYEFWKNYNGHQPEAIVKELFASTKKLVYKKQTKTKNA